MTSPCSRSRTVSPLRSYKLADARQTSGISNGWRTSVYGVAASFSLPARTV